jgi:S-adenosylhomocysteine hydrolase
MKGFNKLVLCPAAMHQAVEEYLNRQVFLMQQAVKVTDVKVTSTGEFTICMNEPLVKEKK